MVRGTRVPVQYVLELSDRGYDVHRIHDEYPTVPKEVIAGPVKLVSDGLTCKKPSDGALRLKHIDIQLIWHRHHDDKWWKRMSNLSRDLKEVAKGMADLAFDAMEHVTLQTTNESHQKSEIKTK